MTDVDENIYSIYIVTIVTPLVDTHIFLKRKRARIANLAAQIHNARGPKLGFNVHVFPGTKEL